MNWIFYVVIVGLVSGFKCRTRSTTTLLPSTSSTHLPKCSNKPSSSSYVSTSSASTSYISSSSANSYSNIPSNSASYVITSSSSASNVITSSNSASSVITSSGSASYPTSYPNAPSGSSSHVSTSSSSSSHVSAPSSSSYEYTTSIPNTSSSSIPVVPSSPPGSCKTNLYGITFSPYDAAGSCLSSETVYQQLLQVSKLTTNIRTYGADCNQLPNIFNALVKIKQQSGIHINVMLGLWTRGDEIRSNLEKTEFIKVLTNPEHNQFVNSVTSGNEERFNGFSSDVIINTINNVKSILRENNINHPVATSETYKLFDQSLINASDFIPVSIYPFYTKTYGNGTIRAAVEGAIQELLNLKQTLPPNKQLIVSETGWPTSGTAAHSFGNPSLQNQREYLALFQCMANQHQIPTYFLEAFNASWKRGDTAEKFFGLLNDQGHLNGGELTHICC